MNATFTSSPSMLVAIETEDGGLFVSKSVLVSEDGQMYAPVRERAAALGLTLVDQAEYEDPSVMFGRVVEQHYSKAA